MAKGTLSIDRHIEEKYISIGKLANQLGVYVSTVRFYSNCHPHLIKPKRDKNAKRRYSVIAQKRTREIHRLITEEGLTHRGVDIHFEKLRKGAAL